MRIPVLAFTLGCLAAGASADDIFKCTDANGKVAYQDSTCTYASATKIDTGPATPPDADAKYEAMKKESAAFTEAMNARTRMESEAAAHVSYYLPEPVQAAPAAPDVYYLPYANAPDRKHRPVEHRHRPPDRTPAPMPRQLPKN